MEASEWSALIEAGKQRLVELQTQWTADGLGTGKIADLDRIISIIRRYKQEIRSTFYWSFETKRTFKDHMREMKQSVWEANEFCRLPRWAKSEIRGYENAVYDLETQRKTFYGTLYKGVVYVKWDHFPEDMKVLFRTHHEALDYGTFHVGTVKRWS